MERGIILESRGRISRFLNSLACVMFCSALTIVPIGALALSRILKVDDFFAPTWLHTLLILTPAMSAIATMRMSYHKEVPHRLLKGHVRPIAALLGMRRLGAILTSSHLLKVINGLLVQRGSKALRRNSVDVRAVVGLLQGVAIAVSLAYSAFPFGVL